VVKANIAIKIRELDGRKTSGSYLSTLVRDTEVGEKRVIHVKVRLDTAVVIRVEEIVQTVKCTVVFSKIRVVLDCRRLVITQICGGN